MPRRPRQLTLFEDYAQSLTRDDAQLVRKALQVLDRTLRKGGDVLTHSDNVASYLKLSIAPLPHEVFVGLFLDTQNRLIEAKELFRGTLTQTSVYPREVVKEALKLDAAAVIFGHNHPSGVAEPSRADELLTSTLKAALALIDVRVLDHVVVAGVSHISFAERGLMEPRPRYGRERAASPSA